VRVWLQWRFVCDAFVDYSFSLGQVQTMDRLTQRSKRQTTQMMDMPSLLLILCSPSSFNSILTWMFVVSCFLFFAIPWLGSDFQHNCVLVSYWAISILLARVRWPSYRRFLALLLNFGIEDHCNTVGFCGLQICSPLLKFDSISLMSRFASNSRRSCPKSHDIDQGLRFLGYVQVLRYGQKLTKVLLRWGGVDSAREVSSANTL
jgi:hypothetical protein